MDAKDSIFRSFSALKSILGLDFDNKEIQVSVPDFIEGLPSEESTPVTEPYKVYTAILSQAGTADPVAIILQNTFDSEIEFEWIREGPGDYSVRDKWGTECFTTNKTVVFMNPLNITGWGYSIDAYVKSTYYVTLITAGPGEENYMDDVLNVQHSFIEIRVYS